LAALSVAGGSIEVAAHFSLEIKAIVGCFSRGAGAALQGCDSGLQSGGLLSDGLDGCGECVKVGTGDAGGSLDGSAEPSGSTERRGCADIAESLNATSCVIAVDWVLGVVSGRTVHRSIGGP
jgi:hypothetical protein